ncbi:ABC transporter ATP-binding protein [Myroides odoratimimus]|uniref:Antibiotic ABC transporter ATP-binding protein n=1 Tax=Myroides odoratimimus TaxID=76832 RepID=A0AAI8G3C6_9FLAO|nr:ABC transporter ATP-binding protein [Myroides odoratimimus]ALU24770.1 antibiotic ABC transporter ATP-binding protein [Myroides odoratimimus]MDM1034496.1 ABC transporter ATP-binding protein [Myroides odoratimimus]MDM1036832.1 ABC transporter ATP-binding protein [Myroides odoratimimus]MDM1051059.1 ABC transporter ATP-binding protein [Myroides odoratimimus]MDM1461078.1 ABC transporter ATP-binding protein [Myroides odoratimimus]
MNEYFKKILHFGKPYKTYAYLNVFFNILYALFSALSFVALIPMLTVLFGDAKKVTEKPLYTGIGHIKDYLEDYMSYFITQYTAEHGAQDTLMVMAAVIISLFLLKNLFNYWAMYFITFLRNGVLKDIRNAMYKKSLELPLSFFSEKRKGDVISRITSDVLEIQHSFLSILEVVVREPLTIIFTIVAMFAISTELTLFVFIFVPISGVIISKVGKTLKKSSQKASEEQGYFLSIIEESLSGLKVIKSFNSEKNFNKKFQDSTHSFYELNNTILNRQNLSSPLSEFLGIVTIAVLLVYGGHLVLGEGTLTGASFIAYIGMAYNILTPAKAMSKASYSLKRGNAAAERVLQVLEENNPIESKENAIAKSSFEDKIEVDNISFKYEEEYVLKDFTLTVPKGKSVALVGQSGSGKSTIANLLTRFWDINEGAIKIDNEDIRNLELSDLRDLIGLVTQDSILFNDTIKNNLKLGKEDATDEEIMQALKIANAYEFVKDLPHGIDTNIGDAGNKLSGGQKQRLSIARAVLKNPPIMILDEATSALDTESEKLVQVALDNMMQNRTSIIIAHRLSTIQKADLIVVMQKGKIVEQGTHEELIQLNGTYSKLVSLQSLE